MENFTLYLPPFNYIDSRLPVLLHSLLASQSFFRSSFTPFHVTLPVLYNTHPPLHPYTRASSSYSAVVQLYARSGQLPTISPVPPAFVTDQPSIGMAANVHHIFVHCQRFQDLRDEYSKSFAFDIENSVKDSLPTQILLHVLHVVAHIFCNNPSWPWPLHSSCVYLGLLLSLLPPRQSHQALSDESQRLLTRTAHSCHLHSIRLAARIWGIVVRHYLSSTRTFGARGTEKRDALLRTSKLTLPPHLHYLFS